MKTTRVKEYKNASLKRDSKPSRKGARNGKAKVSNADPVLENLKAEHKRLAKKADRKLRNLEKYAADHDRPDVLAYAYRKAIDDIQRYNPGAARFDRKAPEIKRILKEKINDIARFLDMPTSTAAGVNKVYKQRTDSFNKHWGTNYTSEELGRLFEDGHIRNLDAKFGYGNAFVEIGLLQKKSDKIVEHIKRTTKASYVSKEQVNDWIYKRLSDRNVKTARDVKI